MYILYGYVYVCAYTNIVTNIQRMWQGQVARISIQIDYIDDLDLQVGSPEKKSRFPSPGGCKIQHYFFKK